jgi:hypothetical protein
VSKYKLSVGAVIEVPVVLKITGRGGKVEEHKFTWHADRLGTESFAAEMREGLTVVDFLARHGKSWTGQKLVLEDDGTPATYSEDALRFLCEIPFAPGVIFESYQEHIFVARGVAGAAKN